MFEAVFTVWDYFDGPRSGLAAYQGRPHRYTSNWDDLQDEYADTFALSPIDDETLRLALEQWQIWRAWELAFHRGEVQFDSHPAHGGADSRYDELGTTLDERLALARPLLTQFRATWRALDEGIGLPAGMMRPLEVEWSVAT